MKRILVLIALSIVSLFAFSHEGVSESKANEMISSSTCAVKNNAFSIGEIGTYKIYYTWKPFWIGAGEVTFKIRPSRVNGKYCYRVTALGKSYSTFDWFYKVRDVYETYIDTATMLPVKFVRDVYEGGYTIYNNYEFDHTTNKVKSVKEDFKTKRFEKTYDIKSCSQDVISAIYMARNLDFSKMKVNDIVPIDIFLDEKPYEVYIRYVGKETIDTEFGDMRCIMFKPLLLDGNMFSGGETMTVYVSDDMNRLPIYIESGIRVGSVRAKLISYEGLRNPLTAKVDD